MQVISCYGNPVLSGKEQGKMRMRAGVGKGVVIEDLHSLVQDNQYAFIFITAKQMRLQGRRGGDCCGMDRPKDRRAGLWHSDGLAINSTCMGLISCASATSFTVCATHPLPVDHTSTSPPLASWVMCCCCPPAYALRECHFTGPPGHERR